jgi:hypothetical protein
MMMQIDVSIIAERYTALLEPEKRRLAALFTEGEWNAMRNAYNAAWTAAAIRGGVLADIQDSIESFGAFRDKIELKLVALTLAQKFALVEMLEEWWEAGAVTSKDPHLNTSSTPSP